MEKAIEKISAWGIRCRTCSETVVLGTELDPRYANVLSFLKPGAFCCSNDHTHDYDSDDVLFFQSLPEMRITEAEILGNRARYKLLG